MKEWVHPNATSKGGPGDPLLEFLHEPLVPLLAYRVSKLDAGQRDQLHLLLTKMENLNELFLGRRKAPWLGGET